MGNVVAFPPKVAAATENPGNGAREALIDYMTNVPCPSESCEALADHMLIWLWANGYMLVPTDD